MPHLFTTITAINDKIPLILSLSLAISRQIFLHKIQPLFNINSQQFEKLRVLSDLLFIYYSFAHPSLDY